MLHYRDKRVKGLSNQKAFSFCFICFFLAPLDSVGAEKKDEGDNQKTTNILRRESLPKKIYFSSNSSDSLSPTSSSKSFSSSNSSPVPEERTIVSVDSENNKIDSISPRCDKKRNRLTRSFSSCKINDKRTKADQKVPSKNKEKKLSLIDLLTETTSVPQELDEKKAIDKKKEIVEELLSSFVDERAVFAALIDLEGAPFKKLEGTYPHTIITPLRELIFQKFPGRVENLALKLAEYDRQMKSISTSDLPFIEIKPSTLENYSELIYPQESEKTNNFSWSLSDVSQLASALYIRDVATFQSIDPNDMIRNLTNQDHASKKAIMTLTRNFNATADLWAFQILAEQNEEKRKILIKNIAFLGGHLYTTHNYHGAFQIKLCFAKSAVSRLWKTNKDLNPFKLDPHYRIWEGTLETVKKFDSYRERLKEFHNGSAYLPIFAVIMGDLASSFEVFGNQPEFALSGLAISLEPLLKLKISTPLSYVSSLIEKEAENPFLKHICGLSEIDEDILDNLSLATTNS